MSQTKGSYAQSLVKIKHHSSNNLFRLAVSFIKLQRILKHDKKLSQFKTEDPVSKVKVIVRGQTLEFYVMTRCQLKQRISCSYLVSLKFC